LESGRLHQLLDYGFDKNELGDLCLDLGVDYESLGGERKTIKIRELVLYLERRSRMDELVATCSQLRPNAPWNTPTAPKYEPYGREMLADLRRALEEHFDEGQVRDLCANVGVDYRRLPGADGGGAARELVLYLARRERLAELVQACSRRRPDVPWANILDRSQGEQTVTAASAGPVDHVKLLQALVTHFDTKELHDLCLELGMDYDGLPGSRKQDKARELVSYLKRRGRIAELAAACSRQRPDIFT